MISVRHPPTIRFSEGQPTDDGLTFVASMRVTLHKVA